MTIECFFDGSCHPINPNGNMGIGAFMINESQKIEYSNAIFLGESGFIKTSNNIAEYLAFIEVLKMIKDNGNIEDSFLIQGDSQLVVRQMNGNWKIRFGYYSSTALAAKELLKELTDNGFDITIKWIPRDLNDYADYLSGKVLIERGSKITDYTKKKNKNVFGKRKFYKFAQ